jgi:hypothetical protein
MSAIGFVSAADYDLGLLVASPQLVAETAESGHRDVSRIAMNY